MATPNPAKDTLTTNHFQTLESVIKTVKNDIEKAKQSASDEGKALLDKAETLKSRIDNMVDKKKAVAQWPITHPDYVTLKNDVIAFQKSAKDELATLAKKPTTIMKFGTTVVKDDKEMISKIKSKLPADGHGNINQALNDVILGRGKATTGYTGVLHASAGIAEKKKGGCTLFFKRSGNTIEVVGVGQHQGSKSYMIYFGMGKEGKLLAL
jgi:hypothetical protein